MPTELAKAYVQIIPSAQGIKGKITEELGGEASSAGKSAGSSIASAIKGAIVAAGIGQTLKTALNEGAALQQSIGGIETLFKDSADTVKAAAAEAYRTAGLSANDYMETVTSFSASLLQGLSGDTEKAASIADMAITDMSDNANKMGTDMSLIQNAYQGFAKKNYTMLDNLKLGYGGTKEEMKRLLADAKELTGIEYDLGNLSDVYSAIHVIQENLGITGTTAKEAATTFSGSLASMKAAASNLLANLTLGEDIGPSLYALEETIYTFVVENLFPMLGNVLSSLPEVAENGISMMIRGLNIGADNADEIVQLGLDLVIGIGESIISALPYLGEAAWNFVVSLGSAIINTDWNAVADSIATTLRDNMDLAAGEILGTDGDLVGSIVSAIKSNLPLVVEEGIETVSEFATGLVSNLPALASAAGKVVADLLAEYGSHLPDLLEKGFTFTGELVAGIIRAIPDVIAGAAEVIANFVEGFDEYDWLSIGRDIISGMVSGISAGVGAIADAAKSAAKSALDAAKDFLGIASPSKAMRDEVGKWIPSGIADGITENLSPIDTAMDDATQITMQTIQSNMAINANVKSGWASERAGISMGGVSINVYATDGRNAREIAEEVSNILTNRYDRLKEVYA